MPAPLAAASSLPPQDRRHDLDALRGFAMLLGIALHAALAFMPVGWLVHDRHTHDLFGLFVAGVHGFRMPVFFVMSGFFTAMLWRRRGLRALLHHRARRIALPLLLGVVTVVPAVNWVSAVAIQRGLEPLPAAEATATDASAAAVAENAGGPDAPEDVDALDPATGLSPLALAAAGDDPGRVRALLDAGADPDLRNRDGSRPLIIAAVFDRADAARQLIAAGAELDATGADGSSALHSAAFFGRPEIARLLLDAGASLEVVNSYGQGPAGSLAADWQTTAFIAGMVGVTLDRAEVEAARAEIAELFTAAGADAVTTGAAGGADLVHTPFFHHLWFLAFLCWLVAAFAVYAALSERLGWATPAWLTTSPLRLLWLVPITAAPQHFMGRLVPVFGTDTSSGLLPMPHVLAFYAVFFAFGALYYDADDREGRVGRRFGLHLAAGAALLPAGLGLVFGPGGAELRWLATLVQAAYPWLLTFGLMGLFRRTLSADRPALRYLSDASYWLYLAHLPLVIAAQAWVRPWPQPAVVKFLGICVAVTALLLAVYQVGVRYTWLGRLLNGPRERPGATPAAAAEPVTS
ncbi:MAG: acyltransferase family protein [Acidobacteriota bacterium]